MLWEDGWEGGWERPTHPCMQGCRDGTHLLTGHAAMHMGPHETMLVRWKWPTARPTASVIREQLTTTSKLFTLSYKQTYKQGN